LRRPGKDFIRTIENETEITDQEYSPKDENKEINALLLVPII
jgi:hypothetical protein